MVEVDSSGYGSPMGKVYAYVQQNGNCFFCGGYDSYKALLVKRRLEYQYGHGKVFLSDNPNHASCNLSCDKLAITSAIKRSTLNEKNIGRR